MKCYFCDKEIRDTRSSWSWCASCESDSDVQVVGSSPKVAVISFIFRGKTLNWIFNLENKSSCLVEPRAKHRDIKLLVFPTLADIKPSNVIQKTGLYLLLS